MAYVERVNRDGLAYNDGGQRWIVELRSAVAGNARTRWQVDSERGAANVCFWLMGDDWTWRESW